jgi:hypothetical protein
MGVTGRLRASQKPTPAALEARRRRIPSRANRRRSMPEITSSIFDTLADIILTKTTNIQQVAFASPDLLLPWELCNKLQIHHASDSRRRRREFTQQTMPSSHLRTAFRRCHYLD